MPRKFSHFLRVPRCVSILIFVATFASAQEYRGLIIGHVSDSSGAAIARAKVTAQGPQQAYNAVTNDKGDYSMPYVQPGTYTLTAEAPGFKQQQTTGVQMDVSQKANVNFTLQVGAITETVTVQAEYVGVNTADASGGTVMDPEKIQNLPLNGRQVYMLLPLIPGVRFTTTTFGPSGNSGTRGWDQTNAYEINGVQNNLNQFTLNGAPITQQTSTARGAWLISPNVDAVQEFKVQTNNYDATYGRSGGGTINVVLKSGTNDLHGTVFDFWRNSIMDANYFQNGQTGLKKGFHNQHQFGGTVGGPIQRNKTFFFGSFEGWREVLPIPSNQQTVPNGIVVNPDGSVDVSAFARSPEQQAFGGVYNPFSCATTNADGSCKTRNRLSWNGKNDVIPPGLVSPIGLKILGLYPAPTSPTAFGSNFVASTGGIYRYNQPIVRVDHNFTERTKAYAMFSGWWGTEFRNTSGFADPRIQTGNINTQRAFLSSILDVTHIFSGTLVGDVRGSFSRGVDLAPNGGLAAGTGKLTPQDLGFASYPVPVSTTLNLAPQIRFSGIGQLSGIIGNSQYSDTGHPPLNENYEVAPSLAQTVGKHNLRYGGQYMLVHAIPCCGTGNTGNGANGSFTFSSSFTQFDPNNGQNVPTTGTCSNGLARCNTGAAVAGLLLGIPSSGNVQTNLPIYESYSYYGAYIQDDWKARSNLTLNLGLRWDVELSPHERHERLNGGFCYTCVNPVTQQMTFPPNNVLLTTAGAPTGLTIPNPILGGFTFIGNGRQAYDTQWNHWSPKFGASLALSPTTVLRGGYGVSWTFGFELGGNTTFTQTTNYVTNGKGTDPNAPNFNNGNPYPNGLSQPVGPAAGLLSSAGDGISFDQRDRKIGRVQQYSLGIQHEFPGQIVMDLGYVGTYSSNLRVGTNFDTLTPDQIAFCRANAAKCSQAVQNPFFGVLPASTTLGSSKTQPAYVLMEAFPQFNTTVFSNTEPVGFSNYNSLQLKVNKRVSGGGPLFIRGLSFLNSFTWSKTMIATSLLNNNPANNICPGCVEVGKPLYRLGGNDRTLDYAFSAIYGLPFGKGGAWGSNVTGLSNILVSNWAIDGVFTDATGTPVNLGNLQTLNYNCPQNNNSFAPAHRTYNEWLYNETPSCFTSIPSLSWTPVTLNPVQSSLRNPWAYQLAMAVTKQFEIEERFRLQFKAEAFNLTNTPIFGGPTTSGATAAIAPVSDTINGVTRVRTPGLPGAFSGYGTIGNTEQNFPRQVQLSLKLIF